MKSAIKYTPGLIASSVRWSVRKHAYGYESKFVGTYVSSTGETDRRNSGWRLACSEGEARLRARDATGYAGIYAKKVDGSHG